MYCTRFEKKEVNFIFLARLLLYLQYKLGNNIAVDPAFHVILF